MKAREWQEYLEEQSRVYGKNIFTVTELANVAATTPHILNVKLARLRQQGLIQRYARGKYGPKNRVSPENLLQYLDSRAYITASAALYRHRLITQVPTTFTCFTNRRHNRSRERITPVGRYVFVCVSKSIYFSPADGVVAGPEQALLDFVYLMRRKGINPETVVTFRNLKRLYVSRLTKFGRRYPGTVRKQVEHIMQSSGGSAG